MEDITKKFPALTAGLRKASERLRGLLTDPGIQRWLAEFKVDKDAQLETIREFGIDVPGFDDCPGDGIDLCNAIGVDPDEISSLDELFTKVRAWATEQRMKEQIRASLKRDAPNRDGPFAPNGFRWEGKEFQGLQPLPWRVVNYLWSKKPDHSAPFHQLAEPVWNDRNVIVDSGTFRSARKGNSWLKRNGIPFEIASEANVAFLKKVERGPK